MRKRLKMKLGKHALQQRVDSWAMKNLPKWWTLDLTCEDTYHDTWYSIVEQMKAAGVYADSTPTHYLAKSLPARLRGVANKHFGTGYKLDANVVGAKSLV